MPSHVSTLGNRLYRNDDGVFVDATASAGVADGGWGWGSCFIDFENDGDLDIYHTNGWPQFDEYGGFSRDVSRAFVSDGDGGFRDSAESLGLADQEQGRGVVCADFDNDGDLEILLLHTGAANGARLYRNDADGGSYLGIRLQGRHPNSSAVGARIVLEADGADHLREVTLGSNFASHNPAAQLFGLGAATLVDRLSVYWPDGEVTVLQAEAVNQYLDIEHPRYDPGENVGTRLVVLRGDGGGFYSIGDEVPIRAAEPAANYHFSHWEVTGGEVAALSSPGTVVTLLERVVHVTARYLPGVGAVQDASVARRWNEVLLQSIRNDYARPTVHARNLFHFAAAMYDAWSAVHGIGAAWLLGRERSGVGCPFDGVATSGDGAAKAAMSFAAYRLIRHRFRDSPGVADIYRDTTTLMQALDLDAGIETTAYQDASAAALGNHIADCYIRFGLADGANESADYGNRAYRPVNPPLEPALPGNPNIRDLDRWQPLSLDVFIDQAGNLAASTPEFLSPEWGAVVPFALTADDMTVRERDGFEYRFYHDPGTPPTIDGPLSDSFRWAFSLVAVWGSHLDPGDGVMWDISPRFHRQHRLVSRGLRGLPVVLQAGIRRRPVPGPPHEPEDQRRLCAAGRAPRDYTRVLAEFWADGPESETPPGHWFVIANTVNDHPELLRRFGGAGPVLGRLEWDLKTYFALGGAMHDAAIAAWGAKGWYDYIRPISALRAMADLGQSTDASRPSYHEHGIPLIPGLIELIDDRRSVARRGARTRRQAEGLHLAGTGFRLRSGCGCRRRRLDPRRGLVWPYQRPTFVTPPFAGYVSGHSTYSASGGRGSLGVDRRHLLSRGHERVPDSRADVPALRGGTVRGHDAAVGDLPGCCRPVQPVAYLGRHPPAHRRHSRTADGPRDRPGRLRRSGSSL